MSSHYADSKALLDNRGYAGRTIRGKNPAELFERAVLDRITESYFWKEQCFGLNEASLCDRAIELRFVGGTYGQGKPTPFLCLALKMAQLVPDRDVVLEYLNFEEATEERSSDDERNGDQETQNGAPLCEKKGEFKYLRALAAFYIRLAWDPVEIFETLEPLLNDRRKLRRAAKEQFTLTTMDQFVDDLLNKDRMCSTSLWKLPKRSDLVDLDKLEPRISLLEGELDDLDASDGELGEGDGASDANGFTVPDRSDDGSEEDRSP
ncbi:pre-mRNA-processing factor [Aulographum hederae CBS 113979]|uniref:Pre-mRNA-splicing factor 38 n=1 Tax=Aulographum hederae CBS 113979 TaxID=1176131 RepID=A0A6G1H4H3_9PEZI|nr:pre-mRNA-processing factor [Aulographum hederae CBS 113979]